MIRTWIVMAVLASMQWACAEMVDIVAQKDTTLREADPNNNLGGELFMEVGGTAHATKARGLIRFDLAGKIPAGAIPTNVSITLVLPSLPRPDFNGVDFGLHRMLQDWGEGTKSGAGGGVATAGEASWISRMQPDAWAQPGGEPDFDFVASASAHELMGPAPNTNTIFSTVALLEDVERWRADSATNFGWMIKAVDESVLQSAKRFASKESPNGAVLHVEYALQEEFRITRVEKQSGGILFSWSGGVPPFQIEAIDDISKTNWLPVTTFMNSTNAFFITADPQKYFRVKMPR
jgi:hypothetical protein